MGIVQHKRHTISKLLVLLQLFSESLASLAFDIYFAGKWHGSGHHPQNTCCCEYGKPCLLLPKWSQVSNFWIAQYQLRLCHVVTLLWIEQNIFSSTNLQFTEMVLILEMLEKGMGGKSDGAFVEWKGEILGVLLQQDLEYAVNTGRPRFHFNSEIALRCFCPE